MQQSATRPTILLIGGSDSSGQAGLSADWRAAAARSVHARIAVTAITAQSRTGLTALSPCPPEALAEQLHALQGVAAIKTGMLVNARLVDVIAEAVLQAKDIPLVLDPVLSASAGQALLDKEGRERMRQRLIPRARLLTPNLPEAAVLLNCALDAVRSDPVQAARSLLQLGCAAVLIKGGHADGPVSEDVLVDGDRVWRYRHPRLPQSARGTGCFLASTIAAGLALGEKLPDACESATALTHRAIAQAYTSAGCPQPSLGLP